MVVFVLNFGHASYLDAIYVCIHMRAYVKIKKIMLKVVYIHIYIYNLIYIYVYTYTHIRERKGPLCTMLPPFSFIYIYTK